MLLMPDTVRVLQQADVSRQLAGCTLAGYTLIEAMANSGGRLPEARCAIEVVLPLLRTLTALHKLGIVHRDLKPEHIICTYGSVKLLDFCEAAQRQTQCLNYKAGQLEYMAPEVLDKPLAEDIFHQVSRQNTDQAGCCICMAASRWSCWR